MKREYTIERECFLLHKILYRPISGLTDEQLGRFFRHIFEWQIDGEAEPEEDIRFPFIFYINQFQLDDEKYLETCETNRRNIKIRWDKSKGSMDDTTDTSVYEPIQKERTNTTCTNGFESYLNDKDKDKDNDNDKDNDKVVNPRKRGEQPLTIPFTDEEFKKTWEELRQQPKWRKKTVSALQKCLDKLSKYPVEFAIELMTDAIANNWQGVVFDGTPERYLKWQQSFSDTHNNNSSSNDYDPFDGCEVLTQRD
jgi:hypothetical protein